MSEHQADSRIAAISRRLYCRRLINEKFTFSMSEIVISAAWRIWKSEFFDHPWPFSWHCISVLLDRVELLFPRFPVKLCFTLVVLAFMMWHSIFDLWLSEQLITEGIIMELDDGYMCVSCGKRRKMLSKMRAHLIAHGINNQHPCPFCERVPTSEDARRRHIQKVHKKALSCKQIRALPPFQDHF